MQEKEGKPKAEEGGQEQGGAKDGVNKCLHWGALLLTKYCSAYAMGEMKRAGMLTLEHRNTCPTRESRSSPCKKHILSDNGGQLDMPMGETSPNQV